MTEQTPRWLSTDERRVWLRLSALMELLPAALDAQLQRDADLTKTAYLTLAMLSDMTAAIRRDFTYVPRPEKGTQSPIETLARRKGTCRDYAMLMIEAARALGLAARFVSGYVYNPTAREDRVGGGNTHAWVRVYLPGSGWVEFDPTNGIVGNRGLIRVAIARDIYQAVPISGTWNGFPGSFIDMDVNVNISVEDRVSVPSPMPFSSREKR